MPSGSRTSRTRAVAETVALLQRRYGSMVVHRGPEPEDGDAALWLTGIPALDEDIAPGGLPRGRLTLLQGGGGAASGRLTLLQALAAKASQEGEVVYVDATARLDPGFLADLGADLSTCLVILPGAGRWREGLSMARALVAAGSPWVGIALRTPLARDATIEHALNGLVEAIHSRRAVCIISVPAPGVAPLAYASSLTLCCRSQGWQVDHGDIAGMRVRLEATKSRLGVPGAAQTVLLRYPRAYASATVLGYPAVLSPAREPAAPAMTMVDLSA